MKQNNDSLPFMFLSSKANFGDRASSHCKPLNDDDRDAFTILCCKSSYCMFVYSYCIENTTELYLIFHNYCLRFYHRNDAVIKMYLPHIINQLTWFVLQRRFMHWVELCLIQIQMYHVLAVDEWIAMCIEQKMINWLTYLCLQRKPVEEEFLIIVNRTIPIVVIFSRHYLANP